MSRRVVIRLEDVHKQYRLSGAVSRNLKSWLLGSMMPSQRVAPRTINALDGITLDVYEGETVGIIGANGAGKSTLLSAITGTIQPTTGRVTTHGSISALLELGAGFHPDLSGRENVFLYGAIMGLSRKQMQARFDEIVDFAELEDFIDQPVKFYSSGMYVRLGFAVAVQVDPDIMLVDEVLAVGDISFQRKCMAKMNEFRKQGKTLLIISHDMGTMQTVSDRLALLEHGKLTGVGDPSQIIAVYDSLQRNANAGAVRREWGNKAIELTDIRFRNASGEPADTFACGDAVELEIDYVAHQRVEDPVFGFGISDPFGRDVHGSNTAMSGLTIPFVEGEGTLHLQLPSLPMQTGLYIFSFSAHSRDHKVHYHRVDNEFPIAIEGEKRFEGYTYMDSKWEIDHA
jgi:ABC-type polysaccharide/polyol phosphate transport system ATPase subunit